MHRLQTKIAPEVMGNENLALGVKRTSTPVWLLGSMAAHDGLPGFTSTARGQAPTEPGSGSAVMACADCALCLPDRGLNDSLFQAAMDNRSLGCAPARLGSLETEGIARSETRDERGRRCSRPLTREARTVCIAGYLRMCRAHLASRNGCVDKMLWSRSPNSIQTGTQVVFAFGRHQ